VGCTLDRIITAKYFEVLYLAIENGGSFVDQIPGLWRNNCSNSMNDTIRLIQSDHV
jgi:hypothetical protein